MSQSGDVQERFLKVLVQQITATRPEYLTAPFTVAEIYQDLVPYRSHRDLIGVEMNGDYEDALFRMLAGEGDYLLLESEVAREEMQRELATANPNTALFREFAAVDVRLHPSRVPLDSAGPMARAEGSEADTIDPEVTGAGAEEVELEPKVEVELEVDEKAEVGVEETDLAADLEREAPEETPQTPSLLAGGGPAEPAAASPTGAGPVGPLRPEPGRSSEDGVVGHIETVGIPPVAPIEEQADGGTVSTEAGPSDFLTVCHWCREELPTRDSIFYCPYCGSDLRPSPCRECGTAMESRWQFCVSCGTDVRG